MYFKHVAIFSKEKKSINKGVLKSIKKKNIPQIFLNIVG